MAEYYQNQIFLLLTQILQFTQPGHVYTSSMDGTYELGKNYEALTKYTGFVQ
jgi:hypothetical protein